MKPKASFDTAYCTSIDCKKKCWRYASFFEFEANKNYWYVSDCILERYTRKVDNNG